MDELHADADSLKSPARDAEPARASSRRWIGIVLRCVVLVAVSVAVGRRVWIERERLANHELALSPGWLVASGALYVLGLVGCASFWFLAMRDLGGEPTWRSTLAAYFAGHLGKYVPGKGLVVVIRAAMVRGPGVTTAGAAVTCAQETALMMATGATVAAGVLAVVELPHRAYLLTISVVLAVALCVIASPPVVMALWRFGNRRMPTQMIEVPRPVRWRTVFGGAGLIAAGWFVMGMSLATTLIAMHAPDDVTGRWAMLTAVVALATVGGFVTFTPGGLGSREWILIETLGPVFGTDDAVIAAIVLRLVWIASEVAASGACWTIDKIWKTRAPQPS